MTHYKTALLIVYVLVTSNTQAMTNQVTKIEILGKKPSQIYDFMFELDKEKYIAWHPKEHKDFRIISQTEAVIGSIFFFHEEMDKLKVKYKWEVMEITKNHKIVMKAQYFIPIYLILTLDQTANGTLVTHDLQIGEKQSSKLFDWFIRSFVFTKSKRHSQDRHAIEEFKNLETLIQ